ncbi:MAG: VWA domain-containing protein, partial [Oscillospiraceae bacterium]|nr:VWA domain-containing protein [Oscillospiraceae bacterium]
MKINLKKTLALTLAIVMVLGLAVSGNVFATEDTNQVTHEGADLSNVAEVGNALQISKQIAGTGTENEFDITLTVKTLQDVRETIIEPDASVILVLDRSASMDKAIATGKNQPSYWDKAKAAAEKFIADFKADAARAEAITPSVKREISVVIFADGSAGRYWQLGSSINTSLSVPSSVGGYKQGTNYEAAFKVANSLVGSAHTANVSVIFLTDGGPNHSANGTVNNLQTTGTSEMESDDGYVGGGGESATGVTAGERGAKLLKDAGIPIYSIYYDTGYTGKDKALQNLAAISGSNVSETDDAVALENLLKETKKYTTDNTLSPWSVTDPMGANVVFKSFAWTAEQVTANANDAFIGNVAEHQTGTNGIIWHILREAKPAVGTDGYYTYTLTYRVALNNQAAGFDFTDLGHSMNGTTDLEYAVGSPIVVKHTEFDIPEVKAYKADLTFTKTGANPGTKLPGATFTLTDGSYVLTATSDADGVVNFANIPSGHTYIL